MVRNVLILIALWAWIGATAQRIQQKMEYQQAPVEFVQPEVWSEI